MENSQILEKAIAKAMDNGFILKNLNVEYYSFRESFEMEDLPIFGIIFDLEFAKAFWKTERCKACVAENLPLKTDCNFHKWKSHLQTMVLKKDPIKYLAKFIKEDK